MVFVSYETFFFSFYYAIWLSKEYLSHNTFYLRMIVLGNAKKSQNFEKEAKQNKIYPRRGLKLIKINLEISKLKIF